MGLSGYYSLDGSLTTWLDYDSLPGASPAMSKLYQDMLSGSGDGVPWFHYRGSFDFKYRMEYISQ